jgi:hypothetical protein
MNYLIIILILIFFYLVIIKFSLYRENFISFRPWKNYDKIKKAAQINTEEEEEDNDSEKKSYEIVKNTVLKNYELFDFNKKMVSNIDIENKEFNVHFTLNNNNVEIKKIKDIFDYFTFDFNSNNYKIYFQNNIKIIKNEFEIYNVKISNDKIDFTDSGYSIGHIEKKNIFNNTNNNDNYYILFIFYVIWNEFYNDNKSYDKLFSKTDVN